MRKWIEKGHFLNFDDKWGCYECELKGNDLGFGRCGYSVVALLSAAAAGRGQTAAVWILRMAASNVSRAGSQATASFQKLSLEKWLQALGDLKLSWASRNEHKERLWDSRPSTRNFAS